MSARAVLDVQLIGHTVFTPPKEKDEDGNEKLIFVPDNDNIDDFHEDSLTYETIVDYDGQALVEFAGRACYQSFHKPNEATRSNADYIKHIVKVGHHSILEHGSVTFYITGISRSLTHEFIRHRHLSPSQLSQRFVNAETMKVVVPPLMEKLIEQTVDEMLEKRGEEIPAHPVTGAPGTRQEVVDYCLDQYCLEKKANVLEEYDATVSAYDETFPDLKIKEVREAARADLPNSTETRIVMSGNYRAWMHFLEMRDSVHADAEIARLAKEIGRQLADHAPNIFGAEARAIWDKQD